MGAYHLSLLITVTLLLGDQADGLVSNSVCTQEAPVTGEPSRPVYKGSYTTQIAAKVIHSKLMDMITESYDADKKMMANELTRFSHKFLRMLDFNTKTYYIMYSGRCLKQKQHPYLKDSYMGLTEKMLSLGSVWKYKGITRLRGAEVKRWDSCVTGWGGNLNYSASFYYNKNDLTPFRLEVKGVQFTTAAKTALSPYHSIFDYFIYSKQKPSPNAFTPPPGVTCDTNSVATPPLPMSASYREEEMDTSTKTISYKSVVFDTTLKISQEYDVNTHKSIIRDFNRGIQFDVDYHAQTCKRKNIYSAVGVSAVKGQNGAIDMASLKQFFLADGNNFTKNGQYKVRGILCDVYTKRGQSAASYGESVVEIYISADSVELTNNLQGDVPTSKYQVVRVLLRAGKSMAVLKRYDIYNFDPAPKGYVKNMRLRPCFDDSQVLRFKLVIAAPASASSASWDEFDELEQRLKETVCKLIAINYLRLELHWTTSSFADGSLLFVGKMYERENSRQLFKAYPYKSPKVSASSNIKTLKNSSNTPNICADYCTKQVPLPDGSNFRSYCYGFSFHRDTHDCKFYFNYIRPKLLTGKRYHYAIDFYERSKHVFDGPRNDLAYSKLKSQIDQGKLSITLKNGNVYKANYTEKTIYNRVSQQKGQDSSLKHFYVSRRFTISSNPREQVSGYSVEACARFCLNALAYECEAFLYEAFLKKCMFYDVFRPIFVNSTSKPLNPVYIRSYSDYFDIMPGLTAMSTNGAIYTGITDSTICAKLCFNNKDFYCESFELCGSTCVLGHKHFFDVPRTTLKTDYKCNHFSRKYITDYGMRRDAQVLTGSKVITISDISVKKCAHICSTSPSYNCNVFEFNRILSTCRVSSIARKMRSLSYRESQNWDVYQMKKGLGQVIDIRAGTKPIRIAMASTQKSGAHSPGDMGGIAIGMILLGIILTIVGALVVFKMRSGTSFPGVARFSKERLEEDC